MKPKENLEEKIKNLSEENENLKTGVKILDNVATERLNEIRTLKRALKSVENCLSMQKEINRIQKENIALLENKWPLPKETNLTIEHSLTKSYSRN
jgi:hypothetical protein